MATTSGPHSDPTRSRVASLSAKEYVEKFKLDMYMKDVVRLVLGRRDEAIQHLEQAAADAEHPDAEKAAKALERMRRGDRTL